MRYRNHGVLAGTCRRFARLVLFPTPRALPMKQPNQLKHLQRYCMLLPNIKFEHGRQADCVLSSGEE